MGAVDGGGEMIEELGNGFEGTTTVWVGAMGTIGGMIIWGADCSDSCGLGAHERKPHFIEDNMMR